MGSIVVQLTVEGEVNLDRRTRAELDLRDVTTHTVLSARVRDQAALYGLIQRLAALGLELIEMRTGPRSHADVEITVRGRVGSVLQEALRGVNHAVPAATTVREVAGFRPEEFVAALIRAAVLPPKGEEEHTGARKGGQSKAGVHSGPGAERPLEDSMDVALDEMGPVDWLILEFPENRLDGTALPLLIDLVDRGIIRILDLAFLVKDTDGNVTGAEIKDLAVSGDFDLTVFDGASSGILADDDLREAGDVLAPGSAGGLLVYENTWAAPFATAVRRGGGVVVASGRIPIPSIVAALDASEGLLPLSQDE